MNDNLFVDGDYRDTKCYHKWLEDRKLKSIGYIPFVYLYYIYDPGGKYEKKTPF